MSSFETFDWNTEFQSNRWKEFQRNTDVPYGMDEQDILYRLKLKYFKKFIDSTYDPYAKIRNSTSSSNTSPIPPNGSAPASGSQRAESFSHASDTHSNQPYQPPSNAGINALEISWIFFQSLTLIFALLYFIPFFGESPSHYSRSFFAALIAHAISMYKSIGRLRFDTETLRRVSTNESFQYSLLYALLASSPPLSILVFPVAIYALFHVATYWNTHSDLFPEPLRGFHRSIMQQHVRKILGYQSRAQIWAAQFEVGSMFILLFTALTGYGSILLVICYYWFLSFRYITNYQTRVLCDALGVKLDGIFLSRTCPPFIQKVYGGIRTYLRQSVEARTRQ